ncbi:Hsp20/alpha crystallin family protein [Carbonactinospora thermoautotrophica]|nr:Hsp20/alpha crystallin family protein [Carbonactinospora thermoautotrophica]KWX05120.1 heat-shock protein Hsp20 [Carbonactinospora thermoautotrophica]KWX05830.1 heat-shock protein Hsp20 [Carbonactinospora thermoautotrophica]MCX9191739.1 Hsp20/alpha crystallin family protein [Carbonactinospora thermoautotrophica]
MALPVLQRETALWDPFREFADLHQRMGQLMQSVLGAFDGAISAAPWSPLADVEETDDAYLVQIDLPGVRRDDVTVEVIGNELTVHGEVKERERTGVVRHRARRYGQFDYRLTLPADVDADHVSAELADGVLTVRVPKTEEAKPRRIEITAR